jgi:diguanylate cyclase (GGDEF)-like protein/PAS domain S-box-containing protein
MSGLTPRETLFLAGMVALAAVLEIGGFLLWPWLHLVAPIALLAIWIIRTQTANREIDELKLKLLHHKRLEVKSWYFESIIGYSANIIFTIDSDNRILKFNRGSERTFGVFQTEVVGREVHDLFEDSTALSALIAEVEKEGVAENPSMRIHHADPSVEIWLQTSVTRMLKPDQEAIGTVFNCVDITKRRQLEIELQEKNQQLLRLSITDGLTGLYNVRHFHEELNRSVKSRRRFPDRSLSIALLDVDHFKRFNDTKGHQAGDRLLVSLGHILQGEIRHGLDQAFRYGGDEFVLLLPDTKAEGARIICDRIQAAFKKAGFAPTDLSIGIAGYTGSTPTDSAATVLTPETTATLMESDGGKDGLIKRADVAMYTAKSQGGGIVIAP